MIPLPTPHLAAIVAVAALLAGAAGGWVARGWQADKDLAELRDAHSQAVTRAVQEARAEEQRRTRAVERIALDAENRAITIRRDAGAAADAARRLREHVALLAARGAVDPSAPAPGPATGGSGLLLPDLFGRSVDRTVELAAFADAAHSAGLACERAWDAVRRGH